MSLNDDVTLQGRKLAMPAAVAPPNPKPGQVWLSTRWQDAYIPAGQDNHVHVLGPGGGWESSWLQEPQVWYNQATAQFCMLYTGGNSSAYLGFATCPASADPLTTANWTKSANPVIGNGYGGWAGGAHHSGVFVEGSTVYAYWSDPSTGNLYASTASTASPSSFTHVGVVLTTPSGTVSPLANPHVLNIAGTYTMFYEARDSTSGYRWQQGKATCATPTGTYTSATYPLPSLAEMNSGHSTASNMFVIPEGSGYTAWFHASWGQYQINGTLPTSVYRAYSPDLSTWTITDGQMPLLRLEHPYEVDQIADICLVAGPSGVKYAFWSANDNTYSNGHIMGALVAPRLMQWDGAEWKAAAPAAPRGPKLLMPYIGYNTLGSTFTTTTANGTAVNVTGLSFTSVQMPDNTRAEATLGLRVKSDTAGKVGVVLKFTGYNTNKGPMTASATIDDLPANTFRTFAVSLSANFIQGRAYGVEVDVVNYNATATTTVEASNGSQLIINCTPLA